MKPGVDFETNLVAVTPAVSLSNTFALLGWAFLVAALVVDYVAE